MNLHGVSARTVFRIKLQIPCAVRAKVSRINYIRTEGAPEREAQRARESETRGVRCNPGYRDSSGAERTGVL